MNRLTKSAAIFGVLAVLCSSSVFAASREDPRKDDRPTAVRPADPRREEPKKHKEIKPEPRPEQHREPDPRRDVPHHHKLRKGHCQKHGWYEYKWDEDDTCPKCREHARKHRVYKEHCPKHGWYEYRWNEDDRCPECKKQKPLRPRPAPKPDRR